MKHDWLIIPDYQHLSESLVLSETYQTAFEYNDFYFPKVYSDKDELQKRIHTYKNLNRDRSRDTLHGVFLDISIASSDRYIRDYSLQKVEQSMYIAAELGVKGVVFHTGLIAELQLSSYIEHWLEEQEKLWRRLLHQYPTLYVYMENTFEKAPDCLIRLKERLPDEDRFMLCLDYGHACLTVTPPELWVASMAKHTGHIHLNDNDLVADLHQVPGDGVIDFGHFKNLLLQHRLHAPILLELSSVTDQKRALEYMSSL